jgi:DNA-binding NarL/FixJ family response regulator
VTGDPQSSAVREPIAVALAISDEVLRGRALHALAAPGARFVVVADAADADVVVADALAPTGSQPPELPVIIIGERGVIEEAMRRGYAGGLSPSFSDAKLEIAIQAAALGLVCSEAQAETMPLFDDEADADINLPELSLREVQVLQALITGASNKEIARRLDISIHTAKFHVASIVTKLGASGRTDAVARAMRLARSMI